MKNVNVNRKTTHMDTYLDVNTHQDERRKLRKVKTLIHRAISLPTTLEDRTKELNHITNAMQAYCYMKYVISSIVTSKAHTFTHTRRNSGAVFRLSKTIQPTKIL